MHMLDILTTYLSQHPMMSFAAFMQQVLYAPSVGYYNSSLQKLGRGGDFITAPELTPLFGKTLANQCQQVIGKTSKPTILEFGAGSGQLCVDLLKTLESLDALPDKYLILEVSGNFSQRQRETIQENIPHLANRVQWLSRLPKESFDGIILANEVLDAMPVHRFMQTKEGLLESFIHWNAQGELTESFIPTTHQALIHQVNQVLPKAYYPYISEVNLQIPAWLNTCSTILQKGALFLLDYGFPEQEYYHPDRDQGTLMCHYQHQAHTQFLLHPGEQDITAHVDFTHVAIAAESAGFEVAGYTNQASFLLANGMLEWLNQENQAIEKMRHTQAVKKLLQPNEMGELFKVMALTKGIDYPLQGFQLLDKRATL
jgi:SAM-dependent MidA family methyltransferase